jgi:hypothetical protein
MKSLARLFQVVSLSCAAYAGPIVGGSLGGSLYTVDPFTGATTAVAGPSFFPISSGPTYGTYIGSSGVNPYLMTYPGISNGLFANPNYALYDFAYDPITAVMFATGNTSAFIPSLYRVADSGLPINGSPGSHFLNVATVALNFTLPIIEAIPGFGLYATDGVSAFSVDETTGVMTQLSSLTQGIGPRITGLAYDPTSGRTIASGGGFIYRLDPATGVLTILNATAPVLQGLAAVNNSPEPGTVWLFAFAGAGLWVMGHIHLRKTPRRR